MIVKVYCVNDIELPVYATIGSSGIDLRAYIPETANQTRSIVIPAGSCRLIPTGLHVEIPFGYEIQIRSRSGMALKHMISVLDAPGTIDSDYRGEIGVTLMNHGRERYSVNHGDRIAQAVFCKVEKIHLEKVSSISDLSSTERGSGGFGSTGKQ